MDLILFVGGVECVGQKIDEKMLLVSSMEKELFVLNTWLKMEEKRQGDAQTERKKKEIYFVLVRT